jgi:hypothetical protein
MNMAKRHRFLSDIADKQQMKPAGGTYWDARVLSVSRGAHDAPQSTRSLAAIPDQFTHDEALVHLRRERQERKEVPRIL